MRTRLALAVLTCAVAGVLVACEPADGTKSPGGATPSAAASVAPGSSEPARDGKPGADQRKKVPAFVGMGLQSAQDAAKDQGFHSLKSHDALGRGRMQAFHRNWKVCSQNVAAGTTVSTGTTLDFGAVKLEESCPAKDEAPPSAKGGKMPDFKGKSMKAARAALDASTSLTVKDASPDHRWVLMESNWQVCSQTPGPGTALKGQPVSFTAVKFGESCP
ncbi:PASTA domain-containing protein [Streptomyces sp. NPDC055692]|uniref:PASTA domain-containing protein n=1 Tax=Streptomyces sp. NPDC055692 TaxID=3155683 RepID=UPI00344309D3